MGEILTEKQLCEEFKVVRSTAYEWRKKGCPFMGTKGSIRYDKQEVIEWLKSQANSNIRTK